ncbi:MAG: glycoside hydrolase family 3 C-terminal domain-containing protein [Lentimicrobiaceae bacterium]|nr:glycoside hydrolase family 3 C-terminal domain-containing protein [Lentimicrobiaceae bacterium]
MKKLLIYLLLFVLFPFSCSNRDKLVYKDKNAKIEARVEDLICRMTVEEKVAQTLAVWRMVGYDGKFSPDSAKKYALHGLGSLYRTYLGQTYEEAAEESNAIQKYFIENTRLGIPVLISTEGLHGLMAKNATVFPMAMGLASSWDTELFHRVYTDVALETRALGIQQLFSPNLDIVRDPRWGRTDENFGEDPYLTSRLGVAFIKALQGNETTIDRYHVAATAKHFAVHGQPEGGINQAPGNISEREILSAFLPSFEAAVKEAKVRQVMPSYNEIDGIPSHKNRWLLREVLREKFGFNGVVISDYCAVEQLYRNTWGRAHFVAKDRDDAARLALGVGVDFDLSEPPFYSYPTLVQQIKEKKVSEALLDESVQRILTLKFELGLFDNPYVDPSKAKDIINCEAHRALALEAAHKSVVLLKNDKNLLPLNKDKLKTVAVIGPNANITHFGNYSGTNEKATTLLDGIKNELGAGSVKFAQGCFLTQRGKGRIIELYDREKNLKLIREAVAIAKSCDVIILAIGDNTDLCHEFGDLPTLDLVGEQNDLVKALEATGVPLVVLLFNGRPLSINYIEKNIPAILECWHPGEATGTAMSDLLFGKANPSGKLTITFPISVGHIPCYYNRKPSSQGSYVINNKKFIYPFGYGLSYTTFEYSNFRIDKPSVSLGENATVSVDVKNTGKMAGDEIVQLYIRDLVSSVTRPVKELKGFERISLSLGETKKVSFIITPDKLEFYNEDMKKVIEPGMFNVMVGRSSENLDTLQMEVK